MRFAFCLYNYFPYSGLARDFLRIFLQAQASGHDIDVYVSKWQGDKPPGINLTVLDAKGLTNHGRNAQFHHLFKEAISKKKYDAVMGFNKMPGLDIYYGADYCYVARAKPRYSPIYRLTPRYHYQTDFEKSVFDSQSNTYIFSLSAREMSVYQQHYGTPESRFELMPPTLDISRRIEGGHQQLRDKKRLELGLSVNDLLMLFIGSGFRTKGLDRAFKAMADLPEDVQKRTQLFVVGQDNIEGFDTQLQKLDLTSRVRFLGGRSDVPELMLAGDLLIHPAYSENTGTVILEAIISGLPVIATDVCGYAQHIKHANAGVVLHSPFVQKDLSNSLLKTLTAPKEQWRKNGIEYGKNQNLYIMPETAVRSIEQWVERKRTTKALPNRKLPRNASLYLNDELADAFVQPVNIGKVMATDGEVIREAPGRRTVRFKHADKRYFLKNHTGVGWGEILKNLSYFKKPVIGAQNEWHGIHHLKRLSIDTITPVGYGMTNKNPAKRQSFIITQALEDTVSLEDFCGQWATTPPETKNELHYKRWLISKLAQIARDMHNSGANHRDFYLIHFLLKIVRMENGDLSTENSAVYLIDLHRMQLRKRTPYRWVVKDIAGLFFSSLDVNLSNRDLYRFMKAYRASSLRETLLNDSRFWENVRVRGHKVYEAEKRHKQRSAIQHAAPRQSL
ncbi:MAG: UDP-glucose:(heptosyl)LPS alpha-1,3-glucosyltransferase [Gammaproteobacteria bacterium]|jgi:UDP-glucose:(heptosyl)LPS alpha-1,3-glucosyltransferase